MDNKRGVGTHYENVVVRFLEREGLTIISRNFRCRSGEIDIIAKDGDVYAFIEVKYRNTEVKGHPSEAVDLKKQKRISKVALFYLTYVVKSTNVPCRFDVVSVLGDRIEHIKNAFNYIG